MSTTGIQQNFRTVCGMMNVERHKEHSSRKSVGWFCWEMVKSLNLLSDFLSCEIPNKTPTSAARLVLLVALAIKLKTQSSPQKASSEYIYFLASLSQSWCALNFTLNLSACFTLYAFRRSCRGRSFVQGSTLLVKNFVDCFLLSQNKRTRSALVLAQV